MCPRLLTFASVAWFFACVCRRLSAFVCDCSHLLTPPFSRPPLRASEFEVPRGISLSSAGQKGRAWENRRGNSLARLFSEASFEVTLDTLKDLRTFKGYFSRLKTTSANRHNLTSLTGNKNNFQGYFLPEKDS